MNDQTSKVTSASLILSVQVLIQLFRQTNSSAIISASLLRTTVTAWNPTLMSHGAIVSNIDQGFRPRYCEWLCKMVGLCRYQTATNAEDREQSGTCWGGAFTHHSIRSKLSHCCQRRQNITLYHLFSDLFAPGAPQ